MLAGGAGGGGGEDAADGGGGDSGNSPVQADGVEERNLDLIALSDRKEAPDSISVPLSDLPASCRLLLLRVVCQNLFMLLQKRMLGEIEESPS